MTMSIDAFGFSHRPECRGPFCREHQQAFCWLCPPCCDAPQVDDARAMLMRVKEIIEVSAKRRRQTSYAELRERFLTRYGTSWNRDGAGHEMSSDLDDLVRAAVREAK